MKKTKGPVARIKIGLMTGLVAALAGCAGYIVGGYDGGATVIVPEPDLYLFGGDYDHRRDAHDYSHRGHESRGAAHGGRNHDEGHSGGEKGGRR